MELTKDEHEQRFRARAVTGPTADLNLAVIKTHAVLPFAMAVKSSQYA